MSYERDQMLKCIKGTSWREMQGFASRVNAVWGNLDDGSDSTMAEAIVRAAEELLEEDAESARARKAAEDAAKAGAA